jgi:hypothetical protein
MPLARRPVWLGSAAAVGLATAVALLVTLIGDPGEDDLRTALTLVAALLCGGAAVAALELLERPALQPLGALVLAAAAVDFVLFVLGIWKAAPNADESYNDWTKLVPIGAAWAIALIVTATTALAVGRGAALAVGVIAAAGAVLATGMVWSDTGSDGWAQTTA